jgi:hypothetical protein
MHRRTYRITFCRLVAVATVLSLPHAVIGQITATVGDQDETSRPVAATFDWSEDLSEDAVAASCGESCAMVDVCSSPFEIPNMLGDFFQGYPAGFSGGMSMDRLWVIANDLDAPGVLPPGGSALTITEAGPVGIFASSVISIQQLQQILRSGGSLPPVSLVGSVADQATMTTALTVSEIQALLASTPGVGYDIVPLVAPPGTYFTAVNAVFVTRNGAGGTTAYDAASSGAMLQGGIDTLVGGEDFDAYYAYSYVMAVNVSSPSAGIGPLGRIKVADGNSPLPRDRAYFHYGVFDGVPISSNGRTLNRFVPGFEKTFLDGTLSLEMRFPFAATVASDISMGTTSMSNSSSVEFGNIAAYLKGLIYTSDRLAVSGGMGITVPTADDLRIQSTAGDDLIRIDNEAVHLHPFLAAAYAPSDRWFAHGFCQLDVATNGNSTAMDAGNGLTHAGYINDSTFLFADAGLGYWLRRCPNARISGIAPTVELHYNTSLQEADYVVAGPLAVGNFGDNVEALNLTMGSTFLLGSSTNLAVGYVTPLGGGADRQLDGGLRVLLDYGR